MRIALLHPTYWPEVRRGSERHVHDLAVALAARGHAPRIVTTHPGRTGEEVEDGVPVLRLHRPRASGALLRARRVQEGLAHAPALALDLRRRPDAVVHAFWVTDAVVAATLAHPSRPAVFSYMGLPDRGALTSARGRLALHQRALARCAAVTTLSCAARDAVHRWLGVEARVIHPGVDLAAFRPGGARDPRPTLACAADAEDPRKRIPLLVAAFRGVRRVLPAARLELYDSPVTRALAGDGIELVSREVPVSELFARAWATALPATREAFGLVLVESLACGRPVVAAAEGGPLEILGDAPEGIGALVRGGDPAVWTRALIDALELAEDPGTEARCRARAEHFSTAATARAHEELYAEVVGFGAASRG